MPVKPVQLKLKPFKIHSICCYFRDNLAREESPRQRAGPPGAATSAAASVTTTSLTPCFSRLPSTARGPLPLLLPRGPTVSSRRPLPTSTRSAGSSTGTGGRGGTRGSPASGNAAGGTPTASPAASPPPTSPPTKATPSSVSALPEMTLLRFPLPHPSCPQPAPYLLLLFTHLTNSFPLFLSFNPLTHSPTSHHHLNLSCYPPHPDSRQ